MKPYYDDSLVTIYHADCREILPVACDVVITDPPFGIRDEPIRYGRGRRGTNIWHPPSDWDADIDPQWCRLTCSCAPVVAWLGHWRMREKVARAMPHPIRAEIVWAKDTHVGHPCPVAPRDERIWLFSAVGIRGRRFETSVWDEPIIPTWAHRHHKNEKPLNLMSRLVAFLTDYRQLVIDPFMGSGTTLVAAKNLGRRAIGIEIEERYCEIAAERCRQEVMELGA